MSRRLPAEIKRVSEELGIPIDYLTYPLDADERARIEKDEGATQIILRVPRHEGDAADMPYATMPLGIILTVPMLVASIYGMNVKLPFQDFERGFWVVMGIMAIVTALVVYVFWKRDWF